MISLKECNERIKSLQLYLQNNRRMTNAERIAIYDTLTFYLDTRALLVMRFDNTGDNERSNNDLAN